ncbi:MAG: hypothetical protein ACOCUR_00835 [Nanoarchaeota archaeon]
MPNEFKAKCVFCDNEYVTKAKTPRCNKCGSRRYNKIDKFSVQIPANEKEPIKEEIPKSRTEQKDTQQESKQESKSKNKFFDDVEKDIWG